ncbi:dephospho-CoA kinase [Niallia sp. 01092]|uniref:dephospho-CoA kinase n=1 Tax=unclassified Niallia TaxID=2837522 RepID=UPI003FD26DEE
MTLIVGLTGGIASGKSTISAYFQSLNFPVIDADVEARLAVEAGEPAYNAIVAHFGTSILQKDGSINRGKLGEIVFNNEKERKVLNSIVHPEVRKRMDEKKKKAMEDEAKMVILDIPLLFENNLHKGCDQTILVYVEEEIQIKRLMKRNKLSYEEAVLRIQAQMLLTEKRALADELIDNNGTIEGAKMQAKNILKKWGIL